MNNKTLAIAALAPIAVLVLIGFMEGISGTILMGDGGYTFFGAWYLIMGTWALVRLYKIKD